MKNNDKFQIYGRYSLGSGNILSNPDRLFCDIGDFEVIESYKRSITKDMLKAGIPLRALKNYKIFDSGTGRNAIAFYKLGAKKVKHYDISRLNVKRLKEFIKVNSLQKEITTKCVDLVKFAPPRNNFDLVFLHGIVPCFSNVEAGLKNCLDAVKKDGYISLYFYRSGVFSRFVVYLIRDLIDNISEPYEYFANSIILYSNDCRPNKFISDIMDAFFTPNLHLYTAKSYISFVQLCGFEIVSSSKLDPFGKDIDHRYAQPAVVITCKRTTLKNLQQCNFQILTPEKRINQLDPTNYSSNDKEILKTIGDYNLLKKAILYYKIPQSIIMCLVFQIYNFMNHINYIDEDLENHKSLQLILTNARKLIEKEF